MLKNFVALACGLIFSVGLIVSQMVYPTKVLDFLDVTGHWDPSLAFVMAGALLTLWLAQHFIFRRPAPIFDGQFHLPKTTRIDLRLIAGAALFGVGWGLVGLCPGPAIVAIGFGNIKALIFTGAMAVGIGIFWISAKPR